MYCTLDVVDRILLYTVRLTSVTTFQKKRKQKETWSEQFQLKTDMRIELLHQVSRSIANVTLGRSLSHSFKNESTWDFSLRISGPKQSFHQVLLYYFFLSREKE